MTAFALAALGTAEWIGLAVSAALFALAAAPVAVFVWLACTRDSAEDAVLGVERFEEVRGRARLELKAMPRGLPLTSEQAAPVAAAIDRYLALKDEARGHLWPARARDVEPEAPPEREVEGLSSASRFSVTPKVEGRKAA